MKKILVPIDFSDYSLDALDVAKYIAKVKGMAIRILHVVEDLYVPYYSIAGGPVIENAAMLYPVNEIRKTAQYQIEKIVEEVMKENIQVEYEIIIGAAKRTIIKNAEENNIDLIVMGSHGHSALEDIFIGSTSEKVVRASPIPVLTVHEAFEDYRIDRIVFANDFENDSVEPILKRVIDFAEIFMAELFLVRINTPSGIFSGSSLSRGRLDEFVKKFNLPAGAISTYSDRSEEEGIVNYANEVNADLITICTHGRTGLARLFKGSTAEEVVSDSSIPVLTYNISKDKLATSGKPIMRERRLRKDRVKKSGL